MAKVSTLEELVSKYLKGNLTKNNPESYDLYRHNNNLSTSKSYSDAVSSLYADSKRLSSTFGSNNSKINNKGLQNSGYAAYIDKLSQNKFNLENAALKSSYSDNEAKNRASYVGYLDKYRDKTERIKKSVTSHLVDNEIVDLGTAVAYGISAGLSKKDAELVGQSVYEINKKKVFNKVLEQTVSLGLDEEGSKMLAIKMGISSDDAAGFASEISEMLKYYGNLSEDYLEYLEQRAN